MWPYRNRAVLLISHRKGYLETNLIRVGVDMLSVLGHPSELWRFSLCIDFLLQQEDEHCSTNVTHQARLQRFRRLPFQNTQSGASHLFSDFLALNRRWTLKCAHRFRKSLITLQDVSVILSLKRGLLPKIAHSEEFSDSYSNI